MKTLLSSSSTCEMLSMSVWLANKFASLWFRYFSPHRRRIELINYTQPVYVRRDDPNSRQNTIKEIVRRATSNDDWQQVLIFPEGTCTNRSGLITFKPGAFYPGVPVQPVCIRYPNRLDTVSWTWEGPGAYVALFNLIIFSSFLFLFLSADGY